MRRVPQEAFLSTACIFRTIEGGFWYGALPKTHRTWLSGAQESGWQLPLRGLSTPGRSIGKLPPQRSLANILVDLIFFFGGGVKIVYLQQLQFKLNNTNMRNNYITPTCEEIEINLDSTVLQSSVLPSGFEAGGEIW